MSEPKQCCPCCGNRYESGGGCDCDRNIRRIAELEATLDGDPSQTATPEERYAWRRSAIRYADKVERERDEARAENDELKAINVEPGISLGKAREWKRELAEERARLDKLFSMHCSLFVRQGETVRLIETDCGAMILRGQGKDERAAIDDARRKENDHA